MKILTIVYTFAFEKTRAEAKSPFAFAFAFGVWACPIKPRVGILNGSEKVPSVCPYSMLFKIFGFSPSFAKIAPDVTK